MAVCPKCGYEYEAHVRVCPECQEELVAADDPRAPEGRLAMAREYAGRKLVCIYRGPDELSVRRVDSALQAEGLPSVVRSLQISVHDDIFRDAEGIWGEVLVLEEDTAKAREIIEVIQTGRIVEEDAAEGEEQKQ
ncbi:MAG: hypothetical protein ACE5JM_06205 [Armatimonadota bacterium]